MMMLHLHTYVNECTNTLCCYLNSLILPFPQQPTSVSVFEFNIRFLGGLLSAFALTGDEVGDMQQAVYTLI